MKRLALTPSKENIFETFCQNKIGRNNEVARFCNILTMIEGGFTIAIDGQWGCGKTFFVQHIKLVLDYFSKNLLENESAKIQNIIDSNSLFEKVKDFNCRTVYYNAWEQDEFADPIASLAYELCLLGTGDTEIYVNIKSIMDGVMKGLKGVSLSDFTRKIELLEEGISITDTKHYIHKLIDNIIAEKTDRIVIFIDELDRCNPSYAVKLLERIKHYYDDDRIIFVFSVNATQLQHSIKIHYGDGFDATGYLDKFFDLWIPMKSTDFEQFLKGNEISCNEFLNRTCLEIIKNFNFSLREIEKFLQCIRPVTEVLLETMHKFEVYEIIAFGYFGPVLIALKIKNIVQYHEVISGNGFAILSEYLMHGDLKKSLLYQIERKGEGEPEEKLKALYYCIFDSSSSEQEISQTIRDHQDFFDNHIGYALGRCKRIKSDIESIVNLTYKNINI